MITAYVLEAGALGLRTHDAAGCVLQRAEGGGGRRAEEGGGQRRAEEGGGRTGRREAQRRHPVEGT